MSPVETPVRSLDDQSVFGRSAIDHDAAAAAPITVSACPPGIERRHKARDLVTLVSVLAAAIGSFTLGGADTFAASRALVLALSVGAFALLLRNFSYPHRLMPVSRLVVLVLPIFLGALVAGLLAITDAYYLAADGLLFATAVAVAATLIADRIAGRHLAANPLRVAVLGAPLFAAGLRYELEAEGVQEVEVVGWLNVESPEGSGGELSPELLESIRGAVIESRLDLLVRGPGIGSDAVDMRAYQSLAQGCMDLPVRMIDGNQFYEDLFGHVPLGTIDSDWFLHLMHPSYTPTPRWGKRAFDFLAAFAGTLVVAPIVLIAAIAVKLEDGGPIFYRQRRLGEGGRPFDILKLRTMSVDAEANGIQWSGAGDARVTRVGAVLRRTHVDEIPQLFNVLRGEMTFVGPRPERPEIISELEHLFPHYKRRLLVKPGVTGWAQVRCGYAGSELGTAWKLCHDVYYLRHRSLLADALIVLETLAIAARDSHRELRAPQREFLFDPEQVTGMATFRRAPAERVQSVASAGAVPEISLDSRVALPGPLAA